MRGFRAWTGHRASFGSRTRGRCGKFIPGKVMPIISFSLKVALQLTQAAMNTFFIDNQTLLCCAQVSNVAHDTTEHVLEHSPDQSHCHVLWTPMRERIPESYAV